MTSRYDVLQGEFERQVADREAAFDELSKLAAQSVIAFRNYLGVEADDLVIKRAGKESIARVALGKLVNGNFEPCYRHELPMQLGLIKYSVGVANVIEEDVNTLHMEVRLHIEPSGHVFKLLGSEESVTLPFIRSDADFDPFCEMLFQRYRQYYAKRP